MRTGPGSTRQTPLSVRQTSTGRPPLVTIHIGGPGAREPGVGPIAGSDVELGRSCGGLADSARRVVASVIAVSARCRVRQLFGSRGAALSLVRADDFHLAAPEAGVVLRCRMCPLKGSRWRAARTAALGLASAPKGPPVDSRRAGPMLSSPPINQASGTQPGAIVPRFFRPDCPARSGGS
jgi:hypothetical protein